ncbi:hypothetical protein PHLGIDRAFT_372637 [Phlebiopsis gigantea 11061_1 CR5-6]|uniref:Uncharacterized protein n=1 Tax=Phlebiopsis gigantea (strain 11061_1 CR5-6) TaxID=745531 RepID=A0A0C3S0U0_PHLG1|nr:hypothetical protein PHLGIDRAFT_372637 [Phlebiopsis gigantea 11061_1 CR5-6]
MNLDFHRKTFCDHHLVISVSTTSSCAWMLGSPYLRTRTAATSTGRVDLLMPLSGRGQHPLVGATPLASASLTYASAARGRRVPGVLLAHPGTRDGMPLASGHVNASSGWRVFVAGGGSMERTG